jgi:hypothetical protein
MLGSDVITFKDAPKEAETMPKKTAAMPKFKNESAEADWWASPAGRAYVRRKSAEAKSEGLVMKGSRLVAALNKNKPRSVQIALRLPPADIEQARRIAERKGIGYQTLVKILVHEGLAREARRP